MPQNFRWLEWAKELQAIAQIGLTYSKDSFDIERFQRIREISVEIMQEYTEIDSTKLMDLFAAETGYQTPKIDIRAAVFSGQRILMVRERSDGLWTLPGGWADIDTSVSEMVSIEVWEEATVRASAVRVLAVLDRGKQDQPLSPYSMYKIFVEAEMDTCEEFVENSETSDRGFFAVDSIPELSLERVNQDQIAMCFKARDDSQFSCIFD